MEKIFVLETKNTHYVIGIDKNGIPRHIHWGGKSRYDDYEIPEIREENSNHSALDFAKEEYSVFGSTRYRNTAFKCVYSDNCTDSVFVYKSHSQKEGALDITLCDVEYKIEIVLSYRFSSEDDIIKRYAKIINNSDDILHCEKIMSGEINVPGHGIYNALNTDGSWAGEFRLQSTSVKSSTVTFESRKGTAGHTNSPFTVLYENANEDWGSVYFAALAYGGNFRCEIQRDFAGVTRAVVGISDFDFSYDIKPGESFTAPPLYIGCTQGFARMSNMMNKFAVKHILPQSHANDELPVLYNSWEAVGFKVNAEKQLTLAKLAAQIGCELFVTDDGWFSERDCDLRGLGDWFVNEKKFPDGLDKLIKSVNDLGMQFGLWFEPEMVQKESLLYKLHPDWTYHFEKRKANELRHQLVLNLTRKDVSDYVFDCMDKMLSKYNITYIKWDMNRPFSEIGAQNLENRQELWVRHTNAVYSIADRLKAKYPSLHIEACSSGGGRAEYGALSHFDSVWTSDNTDPFDRLEIQHGYSFVYPIKAMRAWITDWNSKKRCSLGYRFASSMQGALGIGANLLEYSEEEIKQCKEFISLYKKYRRTIQFGDFYRLKTLHKDGFWATQYTDDAKNSGILFITTGGESFFTNQFKSLKLKGIDEEKQYSVKYREKTFVKSGAYLMNRGIDLRLSSPFGYEIITFEKV